MSPSPAGPRTPGRMIIPGARMRRLLVIERILYVCEDKNAAGIQYVSVKTEISGPNGVFATVSRPPPQVGQHPVATWSGRLYQRDHGARPPPGGLDCGGGSIYGTMML